MNNEFFNRDTNVARIDEDGVIDDDDEASSKKDLKDVIRENAIGPKKVQSDAGSVEQHPLKDLIEAARFLASKEAVQKRGLGIKLIKLSPDGTV